jgi:putative nucleotidyltransferase with HDIG domain
LLTSSRQAEPQTAFQDKFSETLQAEPQTNFQDKFSETLQAEPQTAFQDKFSETLQAEPQTDFQDRFCKTFLLDDCADLLNLAWQKGFDDIIENRVAMRTLDILNQGVMDENDRRADYAGRDIEISRFWTGVDVVNYSSALSLSGAKAMVDKSTELFSLEPGGDSAARLVSGLTKGLLRPNLKFDQEAWDNRVNEAKAKIPTSFQLKAGEIIVREGEIITPLAALKLEHINNESSKALSLRPTVGLMVLLLVFLTVSQTLIHLDRDGSETDYRELALTCFLLLWFVLLAWWADHLSRGVLLKELAHVEPRTIFIAMPIPAAAMLGAIFMGPRRTVYLCFLGSFLGAIAIARVDTLSAFLYSCNGCIVSIWGLRHISERSRFIPSALLASLVNCLTMTALTLADGNLLSVQHTYDLIAAAASGILSGILASGFVTLIEATFGLTTNLKLMELGNLNRPLLRDLMLAAPGTYHHSVIVGSMVEAAAEAIGANPHLARVGAYYHDIGKIRKPLYFVENQTGENKHETLAPSLSALVLIGHVKEGAEMARKEKLPQSVVDIVEQHHGTSLMSYFFHKAKENRNANSPEINEGDYRYPGPKPASKEAGLVMLADICEAATRSLTEPTPTKIYELVRKLVNQVFNDGQLDSSELVLRDVTETIRVFNNILVGIYHHRIAYPMTNQEVQNEQAAKSKVIYGHLNLEQGKKTTN